MQLEITLTHQQLQDAVVAYIVSSQVLSKQSTVKASEVEFHTDHDGEILKVTVPARST